ncbi:MAG: radical SAM protein [Candidatus Aminicenantales bacterium]
MFPFDPVLRSAEAERLVMKGEGRLYHRFRPAPYYGGIATADAVGCSFLCAYCWNYSRNENPAGQGQFQEPQDVAFLLLDIARRRHFRQFRITGSEPILGEASLAHVAKVIQLIFEKQPDSVFILETNALMLGHHREFAGRLKFKKLAVRVCLKGVDPESFEKITGARADFFERPLAGLKALQEAGVEAWPALMEDLFTQDEINGLKSRLVNLGIRSELELESLEPYPHVLENLRRRNLSLR